MRTAVIHIGTEKTGSTSIQKFLKTNRINLSEIDYYFPSTPGDSNHIGLAAYCISTSAEQFQKPVLNLLKIKTKNEHLDWKSHFKENLKKELLQQKNKTAIFSTEHLMSRLRNKSEVVELKSLLSPFFNNFRIIIYIRRQDQFATSLFNEMLKSGGTSLNPLANKESFIDNPFFNTIEPLTMWAGIFGKKSIHLRIFDPAEFISNDLLIDFCHTAGIYTMTNFYFPPRQNISLSGDTQLMLVFLNKSIPKRRIKNPTYTALRRYIIDSQDGTSEFSKISPNKSDAKELVASFYEQNCILSEQWLDGKMFNNDFSMYKTLPSNLPNIDTVLKKLKKKVDSFCEFENSSQDHINSRNYEKADLYRDIALVFENSHLNDALFYMELARNHRPDGPLINRKIEQYRQLLNQASSPKLISR